MARVGGIIQFQVNGVPLSAKGAFTYHPGTPLRTAVIGAGDVPGYTETPQPAFIEGAITDSGDLDTEALRNVTSATITLQLANGKVFSMAGAWYAGEGVASTEEGEIAVRYEARSGEEVTT